MARRPGWTEETAKHYYAKLGIKCATEEQYAKWFALAERCNIPCRTLKRFCEDCLPEYEQQMTCTGCCVKNKGIKPDTQR